MRLVVEVRFPGRGRPAAGTPVTVEIRDVTHLDAASTTLGRAVGRVDDSAGELLATAELERPDSAGRATVWAHVANAGAGRVALGDLVTTRSFPLPAGDVARMQVTVDRVGPR